MSRISNDYQGQQVESAGGVIMRSVKGNVEVVLCGRMQLKEWRLPKGTPELGESREETAIREVLEETGLEPRILESLGHVEYNFRARYNREIYLKRVYFYLMDSIGGSTDRHDREFDVVEWIEISLALEKISFATEADILQRAVIAFTSRRLK
jgi:8-oxo-dGTP pyrophosphatase MutT (NUDIX family)